MISRPVFFVGPLPPPVHGFSWVNYQVFDLIQKKSSVVHFDRAPSLRGQLVTILIFLKEIFRFIYYMMVFRPSVVYIGWSGGFSMLVDVVYVFISKVFMVPICLHHHSFAYLNRVRWYNKIALSATRSQFHVVLCPLMADFLVDKYGILSDNISVVSNAAFLQSACIFEFNHRNNISVGFLSNITEAKGIFEFFDLAKIFSGDERFYFYIAGPVADDIVSKFEDRVATASNVTYVGSVYGDNKEIFLNSLDVFVFPTKYVNEAEPVSIAEALRAGLPVISITRGCISGMLGDTGVVTTLDDFLMDASAFIVRLANDADFYVSERMKAVRRFAALRDDSLKRLELLVNRLSNGLI